MKLCHETIALPPSESMRLLRWEDNVSNVTLIGADGRAHPYKGAGETWHYHPEMELTLFTHCTGTRNIGDCIQRFDAPDVVLIGANLPHRGSD